MFKLFIKSVLTRLLFIGLALIIAMVARSVWAADQPIDPTVLSTVVSIERSCSGWGVGTSFTGISFDDSDCKWICHHWNLSSGQWTEVSKAECNPADYNMDASEFEN